MTPSPGAGLEELKRSGEWTNHRAALSKMDRKDQSEGKKEELEIEWTNQNGPFHP